MTLATLIPLTHSATLRRLLYEGMQALGLDPGHIYRQAYRGMPLKAGALEARLVHEMAPLLWQALPALSDDVDIGLHLGEVMQPRPMDVVGYAQQASSTLREALQVFVRWQHILSGGFAARLLEDESAGQACLVIDLDYQGVGSLRQQMECLAQLFSKQLCSLTDGEFRLSGLSFRHAQPANLSEHRRLFGLTPQFAQPHDCLLFPQALLARPLRSANGPIFALLCAHAEQLLAGLQENQLLNRLRYQIDLRLGRERCDLSACAQAMDLPAAALQRALLQQGQGFRALREEVQRLRSAELLLTGAPLREVARACGFAELSPFYRAFRRWYGQTPEQYRSANLSAAVAKPEVLTRG
ncbi:MAG: AraC family transcriptional regulator [Pseudomonadaceae bacterium]|nr:AraC family transcriptional regulator [Pseudomonadaceae bacterium]